MSDLPPSMYAVSAAVVALEIFTDPSSPPVTVEVLAEVTFDGDAYTASDEDGRYVTAGYADPASALRALMATHLTATTEPTRQRLPGGSP